MDSASKKHILSISLVAAVFWLGNSGHYTPLLLTLGAISVVFVVICIHRMDMVDNESQPLHLVGRKLPAYYCWLAMELIRSNISVVKLVWKGNSAISPCARWIKVSQHCDVGKVIYANSITLTPGTVAMDLEGDRVYVHALTEQGMSDLETGDMDRRVAALER